MLLESKLTFEEHELDTVRVGLTMVSTPLFLTPEANPMDWQAIRDRARRLRSEVCALYLAYRHPDTPWHAKVWLACVIGYALSPIDLIPDFIPVIGYLDDAILIPLGITLAIRMIPPHVMTECRAKSAEAFANTRSFRWTAAVVIVMVWLSAGVLVTWLLWRLV